jgi:hypothetical protein
LKKISFLTFLLTSCINSSFAGDSYITPEDIADTYNKNCKYVSEYNNYSADIHEPCKSMQPLDAGFESYSNFYDDENFRIKATKLFKKLNVNLTEKSFPVSENVTPLEMYFKSVLVLSISAKSTEGNKKYYVYYAPKSNHMIIAKRNGFDQKGNTKLSHYTGDINDLILKKSVLYHDYFMGSGYGGNSGISSGFNQAIKKDLKLN